MELRRLFRILIVGLCLVVSGCIPPEEPPGSYVEVQPPTGKEVESWTIYGCQCGPLITMGQRMLLGYQGMVFRSNGPDWELIPLAVNQLDYPLSRDYEPRDDDAMVPFEHALRGTEAVWIDSRPKGQKLLLVNITSDLIEKEIAYPAGRTSVREIISDADGKLWAVASPTPDLERTFSEAAAGTLERVTYLFQFEGGTWRETGPDPFVTHLVPMSDGIYYLGLSLGKYYGANKYEKPPRELGVLRPTGGFTHVPWPLPPEFVPEGLFRSKDGKTILIGLSSGWVWRFSPADNVFDRLPIPALDAPTAFAILEDSVHRIWVSGPDGLYVTEDKRQWHQLLWTSSSGQKSEFTSDSFGLRYFADRLPYWSLAEAPDKRIWGIATSGIIAFDPLTDLLDVYEFSFAGGKTQVPRWPTLKGVRVRRELLPLASATLEALRRETASSKTVNSLSDAPSASESFDPVAT